MTDTHDLRVRAHFADYVPGDLITDEKIKAEIRADERIAKVVQVARTEQAQSTYTPPEPDHHE
jgi:hypothetical protein